MEARDCSPPRTGALKLDGVLYAAAGGPAARPATCSGTTLSVELPTLSVTGVVLAP